MPVLPAASGGRVREDEMSDRVVHFEIPFDDGERATGFYGEAFGWNLNAMPEMQYVMVSTGPSEQGPPSEPGFINGGMLQRQGPIGAPVVTVNVDDIDASLEKIEKLGGKTVIGKQPVGDMGFSAYFEDTEGNLLGLWQNA
jgi:predicted enzyme related to lactoylglutathione lyase